MIKYQNRCSKLIFLFALAFGLCSCHSPSEKQEDQKDPIESLDSIPKLHVIEQQSPVEQSLRGIFVIDSSIAWLSGAKGSILRSINGGDTWEIIQAPDTDSLDFRDIHAFDADHAIAISAGYPSRVYKTENAGQNWVLVHENIDSAAFMNSIEFRDNHEGIIFGDQLNGRHLLLKTTDGGNNWSLVDSNTIPIPLKIENGFAASGSCIAVDKKGNYFIGLGGENSRVFQSNDGNNWEAFESTLKSPEAYSGIYSIAYGNNTLIAVGGNFLAVDSAYSPSIYHMDDSNWQKAKGKVFGYRSVIDYCNALDLWICAGTNGIDISLDNGENWLVKSNLNINTLQFVPNSTFALAANGKGKIYKLLFQ